MPDGVVDTTSGAVRGRAGAAGPVFLGIPYAAAPIGAARFAAPQPPPRRARPLAADEFGPAAPQHPRSGFGTLDMSPFFGAVHVGGPDYLTLNVWAPRDASRAPVMVFVHGGGFVSGSTRSPLYDGTAFARDGVVLVTVAYRLGVIGFLDVRGAPPNRGLRDVLAALRWVHANVEGFGGDPGNVTLFGQSAGATIVGALLAHPETAPLIRRAIMQSGNGTGAFDPEQAARVTHRAGQLLEADPTAADLSARSDAVLLDLGASLTGIDLQTERRRDPLVGLSPFSPVLPRQPAEDVASGVGARIPLLIGTNADEGNLYLAPQGALDGSVESDVRELAHRTHPDPDAVIAQLRRERPGATWGELRSTLLGDALFGSGTRRLVDAHVSHSAAPLHQYRFDWRSTALNGQLGAAHGVELPFVFDCLDEPALVGPTGLLGPRPAPRELATAMHGAWVGYATSGDPGWSPSTTRHFTAPGPR